MDNNDLLTDGLIQKKLEEESELLPLLKLAPLGLDVLDEQKRALCILHKKVLKTMYSPYATNDELNATDIIGILLLHFRFMTVEQSNMLFPTFTKAILNSKTYTGNNRKKIADSAVLSENSKTKCYFLNASGFERYRTGKYGMSEEYLETARIPKYYSNTGIGSPKFQHDVYLRDIPYKCLSLPDYAMFDWYTSIELVSGYSPRDSVLKTIEADRRQTQDNLLRSTTPMSIIADAIMLFRTNAFVIEEDRGTEPLKDIKDKVSAYERYLSSLPEVQNIRLLFSIECYSDTRHVVSASTGTNTLHNIKSYSEELGLKNLMETFEAVKENRELPSDPSNSQSPKGRLSARKRTSMLMLLSEYFATLKDDAPESKFTLEAITEYTAAKNTEKEALLTKEKERINGNRCKNIMNILSEQITPNSQLCKLIFMGLDIIVTSDFKKYAEFITPYESGFLRKLQKEIEDNLGIRKKSSIKNGCTVQISSNSQLVLKNCIVVPPEASRAGHMYMVFELSYNYGDYYRAKELLKVLKNNGSATQFHLLFLVTDYMTALRFVKETNLVEEYCNSEAIILPKKNVYVRFLSYSESSRYYYLPTNYGKFEEIRSL